MSADGMEDPSPPPAPWGAFWLGLLAALLIGFIAFRMSLGGGTGAVSWAILLLGLALGAAAAWRIAGPRAARWFILGYFMAPVAAFVLFFALCIILLAGGGF